MKTIDTLPTSVVDRFKGLYMNANELAAIGEKMDNEMENMALAMDLKYKPFYEKRQEIIEGKNTEFADSVQKFDSLIPMLET